MNIRTRTYALFAAVAMLVVINACGDDDSSNPGDSTSPRRVTNLAVELVGADSLRLQWTAPGDDGGSGTASSYQIRRSGSVIIEANFGSATAIANPPAPLAGGTTQTFIVEIDTTLATHFALRATDDAGNTSQVSNDAAWTPLSPPLHLVKDIPAFKDNTICEESDTLSNGAGIYTFVGKPDVANPYSRRALIAFAIADSLPAVATIDSVQLTLRLSRLPVGSATKTVALHRATADWGEGASDAGGQEGTGGVAQTNDATWLHRFYSTTLWATAGGDYDATASAQIAVGPTLGFYNWKSSGMKADVQAWNLTPATNFGWILIGDESALRTARRFDSRESAIAANRPRLRVWYTVPSPTPAR
ncbi:MAG TPA: hypothetical protein VF247_11215 [Candidatus Krumholzibacteria bacterium]